jgi:PAS domain S-box-containing protein
MRGTFQEITERKRVETALRESEARFRELAEMLPQTVFEIDPDGHFTFCNHVGLKTLGYTLEELLRLDVRQLFVPEERERAIRSMRKRLAGEAVGNREYHALRKDGSTYQALIYASPIIRAGQTVGLRGISLDITERQRAERAIQESKAKLESILESSPYAIAVTNLEGIVEDCSHATLQMHGLASKAEFLGRSILQFVADGDRPKTQMLLEKLRRQKLIRHAEILMRRKDGSPFPCEVGGSVMDDRSGHPIGLVLMAADITDRRQTQEALRRSEEKYRSLIANIPDVVWTSDQHGTTTFMSRNVEDVCGYGSEAICGQRGHPWFDKIHPDDVERVREAEKRLFEEGTPLDIEYRFKRKDGRWVWLQDRSTGTYEKDGVRYADGVFVDVTERRQAEEALRASLQTSSDIVASIPSGLLIYTYEPPDTLRLASGNPAAARLSGLDIAQHIGQTFDEIWPTARGAAFTERCLQVMRTGETYQTEEFFYEDDRLKGVFSIRAFRIPGDRLCVAFENVTEGRRAERALHESQRKLSTLMANLPGMAYSCLEDEQWTMEFASEGCFELTGYKSEDVIGNRTISYSEIIHRDDRERVHEEIERALAANHAFEIEYRIVTCQGEEKWVWERGRLVSGTEGDVPVLEGFVLDISERQEAAERLRAHQRKLRLLASELALAEERERRRIAADLHDHACQSLALSKMKLQNVLDGAEPIDPETLRNVCETLNETLESVRDLTFDLSSPTLYKFGLEAALEELLRDKLKGEHDIRYRFSDDAQPKPLPDDVLILLFQSVRELLINVIKHAVAHEVTLDIRRQNGCIEIVLTDDGVGFEVGDVLSPPPQRRGVGLFNIVERLEYIGGKLNMDSHPGHGSRFTLIAPLQTEAHVAKEPRNGSENPTR